VAASPQPAGWQPIETAPKDAEILVRHPALWPDLFRAAWHENYRGWYQRDRFGTLSRVEPTHWMPLPQPPNGDKWPMHNHTALFGFVAFWLIMRRRRRLKRVEQPKSGLRGDPALGIVAPDGPRDKGSSGSSVSCDETSAVADALSLTEQSPEKWHPIASWPWVSLRGCSGSRPRRSGTGSGQIECRLNGRTQAD